MDRKYNLRLDLQFRCNNSKMQFRQSDNKTSDFFMRITSGGELFNIDNAIVILAIIKPDNTSQAQFLEIREGKIYADLNSNMKDQVGTYKAQALLIYEDERVSTDVIEYEVTEDNILNQLETTVSTTEEFTMLQQMLSRLSVVENSENLRVENENNRLEAEKLREEAIEKIKSDTTKLISDTKKEIADYKNTKDTAINDDLSKYKEATTQSIEEYKGAKDAEINNILGEYKTNTTDDIEEFKSAKSQELDNFKNTKNTELDNYKREKDLAINQYVESKNLEINDYVAAKNRELDEYKGAKDKEIDQYKNTKDKLINDKISEVEAAKQNIVSTANNKISELDQAKTNMQNSVNSKIEEADNRISELQNFESQLEQIENKNIEQDTRLKQVEYKNKVQDVYLSGLFNENKDGRLSVEGEGNDLKLEGSKEGLVEVDKIVGNTMVNICPIKNISFNKTIESNYTFRDINIPLAKRNSTYTYIVNIKSNPNTVEGKICVLFINNGKVGSTQMYYTSEIGLVSGVLTINDEEFINGIAFRIASTGGGSIGTYDFDNIILLEGDYTNKPIPSEHFEGLQSTFEECKVTQEMVDSGEELAENLGKYKCNVKVRGKNLFDINGNIDEYAETNQHSNKYPNEIIGGKLKVTRWSANHYGRGQWIRVKPNTNYSFSYTFEKINNDLGIRLDIYNKNSAMIISKFDISQFTFNTGNTDKILITFLRSGSGTPDGYTLISNIQLEEGTQATPYEPYFERTQTVYLNSPLLKGDEIVCKEDGLYHYHLMNQIVLDGSDDEKWGMPNSQPDNTSRFYWLNIAPVGVNGANTICDKSPTKSGAMADMLGIWVDANIILNVPKTVTTIDECKLLLSSNPITVVYELKEPYYEKISDDKLLLEIPNDATLTFDSIVPVANTKATYTGNVPSVYGLEETGIANTNDIAVTQTAVDFLLMSSMGEIMMMSFKNNTKGGNNMGAYFASRIMKKALKYEDVIRKYPEFKEDIDFILRSEGYGDLIVEVQ